MACYETETQHTSQQEVTTWNDRGQYLQRSKARAPPGFRQGASDHVVIDIPEVRSKKI
jgi:hypothetical protein